MKKIARKPVRSESETSYREISLKRRTPIKKNASEQRSIFRRAERFSLLKNTLEIKNLSATVEGKKILNNLNLTIHTGEIHVIMGKNGSGKSTLLNVLMGNPKYKVRSGKILLNGKSILTTPTEKRANLGLFLAFQNPIEIPGVSFTSFLRHAINAKHKNENSDQLSPQEFLKLFKENSASLKMPENLIDRNLNEGFSGGEKKRAEILQMSILKPEFALLDEIDSGLDIDALKAVSKNILDLHKKSPFGLLLVTHYNRILKYISPNFVHIMHKGEIIKSGDKSLAKKLEKNGYENFISKK